MLTQVLTFPVLLFEFVWSIFYPLCSGLDQGESEIAVIGMIEFGGITSAFGCYLYSTKKVDNTGYSSLISNAHNLKKSILITMDCCNRRLLLLLEDDGLTVDNIILVSCHPEQKFHKKIISHSFKVYWLGGTVCYFDKLQVPRNDSCIIVFHRHPDWKGILQCSFCIVQNTLWILII